MEPALVENLLDYLSYYEWTKLCLVSKQVRDIWFVVRRDEVLERYLRTVGYASWTWGEPEPLLLSVQVSCAIIMAVLTA